MKAGYKETTIGLIPEDWNLVHLGNVAELSMGQSPSSDTYNEDGNGLFLIQGNADIKNRRTSPRIWTTEITKECKEGDIIMTVRAPVGAVAKSYHNACIGRGVCAISSSSINNNFLYYYLINYESNWKRIEQGSTFTAVNGKDISGLEIPYPPYVEQSKIASILSTIDEKIDIINERIAQTQQLKSGLMQQLLTRGIGHTKFKDSPLGEIPEVWEIKKLGSIAKTFAGGTPNRSVPEYYNGSIPWVKSGEVKNRNIFETGECVSEKAIKETATKLIKPNSILIALYGATAGNVGILKIRACSNQAVLAVDSKIDKTIMNGYIYYQLKQTAKKLLNLTQGSGQPNLSKDIVDSLMVAIPPINEQVEIESILTHIDDKIDILTAKRINYEQLKTGLMQQLLTGRIRVKA